MIRQHAGNRQHGGRARIALCGALTCVCLVLQQLLAPLHLVLEDHVWLAGSGAHVHVHSEAHEGTLGHSHDHERSYDHDADRDHEPHPYEDHVDELAQPAMLFSLARTMLAAAPTSRRLPSFELPSHERFRLTVHAPRPPPPRTAAAPRAPPIAV